MKKYMKFSFCLMILLFLAAQSQIGLTQMKIPKQLTRVHTSPEELVSMTKSMPFDQAIEVLNSLTRKFENKVIINTKPNPNPIGINIDQMQYLDALEAILRMNNLIYTEHTDYYQIIAPESGASESSVQNLVSIDTREVVISAVFFEADGSKIRQMGFSWDIFRGNGVNLKAGISTTEEKTSLVEITASPSLDFGKLVTTFKALESDKAGEIVASPQITVRSKEEGRIQVGSDIAITTKDFAGNTVTQFFSTGSIIKVTPEVMYEDSTYFIHLDLQIERSNTATSQVGLEIKKTEAETAILLLDGEETIIGGLFITEESKSREGFPVLKDLPWWCFGLRYLFGYDASSTIKKELIILLKAELLPTLKERLALKIKQKVQRPILLENRVKFLERIKFIKKQTKPFKN